MRSQFVGGRKDFPTQIARKTFRFVDVLNMSLHITPYHLFEAIRALGRPTCWPESYEKKRGCKSYCWRKITEETEIISLDIPDEINFYGPSYYSWWQKFLDSEDR